MIALPKIQAENVFHITEGRTLNWCCLHNRILCWKYLYRGYISLIWGDFLQVRSANFGRESKFSPDAKGTTYTYMSCEYMSCENELSYLQFYLQQACSSSYYLKLNSLLAATRDNENWQIYGRNIDILIWWWRKKQASALGKPCGTDSSKYEKFPFENGKVKAPWNSKRSLQQSCRKWVVRFP